MSADREPAPAVVSLLLVGERPVLVVDVPAPAGHPGGALTPHGDPLPWSFLGHGLALLPGFLEVGLRESDGLLLRRSGARWRLATTAGDPVVDLDEAPPAWRGACQRNGGAIVLIGRGLDLPPGERDATLALHAAAREARIVGGVVATDPPAPDSTAPDPARMLPVVAPDGSAGAAAGAADPRPEPGP